MGTQFQNANKIKFMPLPYIGMFDLDVIYQTSDAELLYQVLYKLNEIAKSQNIIIDNFQKVIEWATEQIEKFTKEQLEEWLEDGTLENLLLRVGSIVRSYDTTRDMLNKSDTLVSGMCVSVKGYEQINDGGACLWYITDDESNTNYQLSVGGLYATLIQNKHMNILCFGSSNNEDDSELLTKINKLTPLVETIDFNKLKYYCKLIEWDKSIVNGNLYGVNDDITYSETDTSNYMLHITQPVTIKDSYFYGNSHTTDNQNKGYFALKVENTNINIINNTFTRCFKFPIYLNNCVNSKIKGNTITNVTGIWGDGILLTSSHYITVDNNNISDVTRIGVVSEGVANNLSDNIIIINNNCYNISGADVSERNAGIWCEHTKNGVIENNTINNCGDFGIRINPTLDESGDSVFNISKNMIKGNENGLDIYSAPYVTYYTIMSNLISDSAQYGLSVRIYGYCELINNNINNSSVADIYTEKESSAQGVQLCINGTNKFKTINISDNMPDLQMDNVNCTIKTDFSTFNRYGNSILIISNSTVTLNGVSFSCDNIKLSNSTFNLLQQTNLYNNSGLITNCTFNDNSFLFNGTIINSVINSSFTTESTSDVSFYDCVINTPINIAAGRTLNLIRCGTFNGNILANVATGTICNMVHCYTNNSELAIGGGTINNNGGITNVDVG